MVGASLALALQDCARQSGWAIRLIEAQPPVEGGWQPSYDNRSTALSHGSRRLFERLGIWQELARRAEPIRQIHVSDRGHPGSARMHAEQEGVSALGYIVENRSEEHTSELQSRPHLVCRLLLEKKKKQQNSNIQ